MSKVVIVGAGAAGLLSSIIIKKEHPKADVLVVEANAKPLRRLRATGNGHCNFSNKKLNPSFYNNPEFVGRVFGDKPFEYLMGEVRKYTGLPFLEDGDLIYPLSFSANALADALFNLASSSGVRFAFGQDALPLFKKKDYDYLLLSPGGVAQPKLGSSETFFKELRSAGFQFNEFSPRLCPLKVKEPVKCLEGLRHKGKISLYIDNKFIYEELGEILFRKDAISGIAVFNISSLIARAKANSASIKADLFPNMKEEELHSIIEGATLNGKLDTISSVIEKPFIEYLRAINGTKTLNCRDIAHLLKNLYFNFEGFFDLESCQVCGGGLDVSELNDDFSLKKDNRVFAVGEFLDIDGLCGGFNLSFAFISAIKASKAISSKIN